MDFMRTHRLVRFVASALIALVTLACDGGAAAAASSAAGSTTRHGTHDSAAPTTTTTTPPASDITWGVQPATAQGPTGKPAFIFTNVTPGTRIKDFVGVTNDSKFPVTFAVYAADALNTPSGGFDVLPAGKRSIGVGAWVTLARSSVTIPATTEVNIPFTLSVPVNATPGDHDGGIVAQVSASSTNTKGGKILVNRRVGVRIYLRVVGPLRPVLSVQHLSLGYHGTINPVASGSATVTYAVKNTGNVALAAAQSVTVTSMFGTLASGRPPPIVNLLPGQTLRFTVPLQGVAPAGPIDAHVTLTPSAPRGTTALPTTTLVPAPRVVRQSTGTWAFPWPQLVLFILFLGLLRTWRRRRRSRRSRLEKAVAAALEQGRREAAAERDGPAEPATLAEEAYATGTDASGTGSPSP